MMLNYFYYETFLYCSYYLVQVSGWKKQFIVISVIPDAIVISAYPPRNNGSDDVGGDDQGGRNGGVEFEKRTDKCEAHNTDQCVGEDECHALQGL